MGVLDAELHDVTDTGRFAEVHDPEKYTTSQDLGAKLRAANSNGVLHQSVRFPEGLAVALFWPDVAGIPVQGEHFSYHWDGGQVSQVRNLSSGEVFRVVK